MFSDLRRASKPSRFFYTLFCTISLALSLTACSGVSQSSGSNSGTGGTGGTGGSNRNLACNIMSTGQGASLGGFVPFNSSNAWNTDISTAPVDPNSATIISNFVGSVNVHPDFGTDPSYGIPYVVVNGSQSLVNVNLNAYGSESDPGPMPVPANAPVEGGSSSSGDRHVLVLDNQNCLRVVQLFAEFQRKLERGFDRGLGFAGKRVTSLHLDIGRCCRPADFSRTGSL
jgi:hypothetical protein